MMWALIFHTEFFHLASWLLVFKVIGPLDTEKEFYVADFKLLENVINTAAAQKIKDTLEELDLNSGDPAKGGYLHRDERDNDTLPNFIYR